MALNVIMMGPPGAGKGTQAARFARERGLPQISTGDILREAMREPNLSRSAAAAKALMDRGELVDDATMIAIVKERLSRPDAREGFVLDGFPRTVAQARALDDLLAELGFGAPIVVDIMVPEDELVRRLGTRRICSSCAAIAQPSAGDQCAACGGTFVQRTDDDRDVVLERLKVYGRLTRPVLEYYRERPTFRVVNGAQGPDHVAKDLDTMIDDAAATTVA